MNRLASASSAYLRSAAQQPIDWYPWGPEAFAEALRADKPVLLDVGAVWCHWCHVMDRESYDDHALAGFLNDRFICIKVDRDERPDVDARYQRAVQAMTGQGGWPLTAILTPEGKLFFGGTYFPPQDALGRPGFRTVLEQVSAAWREQSAGLRERAASIRSALDQAIQPPAPGPVGAGTLLAGERRILAAFDEAFGGFGRSPKFPHPTALRFLMGRWADTRSSSTRHVVEETLGAMARGGIHDHLGGGFHRYSVDRQWVIPHFEKMAYDNAELLRTYAAGALLYGRPEWQEVAGGIKRWLFEVLALGHAGFGTSQDADTGPDDDGSYFTWTRAEIAKALPARDLDLAIAWFGVGTLGSMPHDPDRNVLFLAASPAALSERFGIPPERLASRLERIRASLLAARRRRPSPVVDRTPYTSWNAQLAGALLAAAAVLEGEGGSDYALETLRSIRRDARSPDRLEHIPGSGVVLLEDQVFAAEAALEAYEATGAPEWLQWSEALMGRTWQEHWTLEGLVDRAEPGGEGMLDSPVVPLDDAPAPSGNGVAAQVCARLAALTGNAMWQERHRTIVETFAGSAPDRGLHAGSWLLAADWLVHDPVTMVVSGPANHPVTMAFLHAARTAPLARKAVLRLPDGGSPAGLPHGLEALVRDDGRPRAALCLGRRCLAPAENEPAWRERLAEAAELARNES